MAIKKRLIFIAGLCSMESAKTTLQMVKYLYNVMAKFPVDFYFKVSFDKANRTSVDSFRGIGLKNAIKVFKEIKHKYGVKILTDVHCPCQVNAVKDVVDIIQIPAFLCRQTDLVTSIAKSGKIVNIKKGQFLAPEDVKHIIKKIETTGNKKIMITERGVSFGYHNLVVDYRSFLIMKKMGYPVIFDVTHSQQKPSEGEQTGGSNEYVIPMAKGAVACGVDGLFVECHFDPPNAKCDKATAMHVADVERLLKQVLAIRGVT